MLSQEILDLYKKSRLMTYRAMFGRIREKTGSLSATEAYAVDALREDYSEDELKTFEKVLHSLNRHIEKREETKL